MQLEQIKQRLQQSIAFTQEMLQIADREEWELLVTMEKDRLKLMEPVFPLDGISHEHSQQLQPLLEQLILVNSELERVCSSGREKLKLELSSFNQHKRAVNAYHSN